MNSLEKIYEEKLPQKRPLNTLKDEHTNNKASEHAINFCDKLKMKILGDNHNLF